MKKQWILILVLAVALVAAVVLASRNLPSGNDTPSTNDSGTTESSGTDESTGSIECTLTYEEYQSMSGQERQAHLESFATMDDFLAWLNAAKAQYQAHQATMETIDGNNPIDIGELINGSK